jgi:hypothetical protein
MITDDSFDNLLRVRGFSGNGGFPPLSMLRLLDIFWKITLANVDKPSYQRNERNRLDGCCIFDDMLRNIY